MVLARDIFNLVYKKVQNTYADISGREYEGTIQLLTIFMNLNFNEAITV